jgi:hypothetical protein
MKKRKTKNEPKNENEKRKVLERSALSRKGSSASGEREALAFQRATRKPSFCFGGGCPVASPGLLKFCFRIDWLCGLWPTNRSEKKKLPRLVGKTGLPPKKKGHNS